MLCALSVATSRSYLLKRSAQLFTEATNASWTVVSYNCVTIIPCDILLLLSKRRLRRSYRRTAVAIDAVVVSRPLKSGRA